jgi:hypothetical protein
MALKRLVRKLNVVMRRRRAKKERSTLVSYKALEQQVAETGQPCMNCNVPLTGRFCHICGQKDDDLRRPFWTFFRELLDNTFSADSRLLKSLILLVLVPGGLTRAYLMGRRARFVPPLRLYLVASVSFFLILKLFDILVLDINVTLDEEAVKRNEARQEEGADNQPSSVREMLRARIIAETVEEIASSGVENLSESEIQDLRKLAEEEPQVKEILDRLLPSENMASDEIVAVIPPNKPSLSEPETELGIQGETPVNRDDVTLDDSQSEADTEAESVEMDFGDFPYRFDVGMFVKDTGKEHQGLRQQDIDMVLDSEDTAQFLKDTFIGLSKALKRPKEFNELLNDWLPLALFVLMPIFALLLRLFHWKGEQYYMNHLVFSLHFHSFLFLLLSALIVIVPIYGGGFGFTLLWGGAGLHLLVALKVGFNQGWIRAFFKATVIWFIYGLMVLPFLIFVAIYGLQDI